jgi:hypothetical protein
VNSDDALHRKLFVSFIKTLIADTRSHARFVLTGSSMVLFLHQVRIMKVNGFSLWSNSKFVILGRPLSESCVNAIGETIFNYHLRVLKNRLLMGHSVSEILKAISSDANCSSLLTIRPAVLNDIISKIQMSITHDFDLATQLSIDALVQKIQKETIKDIGNFFVDIRDNVQVLKFFHNIANGKNSEAPDDESISEFISLLCGQYPNSRSSNMSNRQLLLPYSTAFRNYLTDTGGFTIDMDSFSKERELRPSLYFQDAVSFFSEYSKLLSPELRLKISRAVMKGAAELGMGVKQAGSPLLKEITNMSEYLSCPKLRELRLHNFVRNLKQPPRDDVERDKMFLKHAEELIKQNEEPGIVLTRDFRHVQVHQWLAFVLTLGRLNWYLCEAHALVRIACTELMQENLDWITANKSGSPVVDELSSQYKLAIKRHHSAGTFSP